MKLDILLLTRNKWEDYRWIYKPVYVDSSVNSLLRPLFIAAEDQINRKIFEVDGTRNLFFYKERNYCIFVHLYFTERYDLAGRRIYALEGLACRKADCRKFWKLLPLLIEELYGRSLEGVYYQIDEKEKESKQKAVQMELPEADFFLEKSCGELEKRYRDYDYAYLNMLDEMKCAGSMYSFAFGNQTEVLSFQNLEKSYQTGEERKAYTAQEKVFWEITEEEKCRIYFCFKKAAMNYRFSAYAVSEKNEVIAAVRDVYMKTKEGINLGILLRVEELLEKQTDSYGYQPEKSFFSRKTAGIEYTCNYVNVWEDRWNISLVKYQIPMALQDGRRISYERTEFRWFQLLLQHARRIEEDYFKEYDGRDTLYILNMNCGIWIFSFIRKEIFFMEGIFIEKENEDQVWIYLEDILQKYIRTESGRLDEEFEESYSCFLSESKEKLQMESYIISVIPKTFFPEMTHILIYSEQNREIKLLPAIYDGETDRELLLDIRRDRRSLLPPSMFGKTWNLCIEEGKGVGAADRKISCKSIQKTAEKERQIFKKNEDYFCNAAEFFEEVKTLH